MTVRRLVRMLVVPLAAVGLAAPTATLAGAQEEPPHPAPGGFVEGTPVCDTEAPPPGSEPTPPPSDTSTVRIGTYNLLHAMGTSNESLDLRLPLLRDEIVGAGSEIVGVQEVEQLSSRGYTTARLSRLLAESTGVPWSWCFFMANPLFPGTVDTYVGGGNPESDPLMPAAGAALGETVFRTGIGVVSRYPIVETGAHRLPYRIPEEQVACGTDILCRFTAGVESRAAIRTIIDAPGGRVQVVSTHLAHSITSLSEVSRIAQNEDLLRWIAAFSHETAHPIVLTGDFNSREGTPVHNAVVDAGFTDTWRAANPTTVRERIDYVFARAGSCPSPLAAGAGVVSSVVIGDSPVPLPGGGFIEPSDHPGFVSELRPFATDPASCDVTYTARYPVPLAATLQRIAVAFGASSIEDVVRLGVAGLRSLAEQGLAVPITAPPTNAGPVQVTTTWSPADAAALEDAAAAWGIDPGQLHRLGGHLVALLLYLAIVGAA